MPSQALSDSGKSSVVNTVSADSLLAGSINFYYYLVMCVLTVVWLAAFILMCFVQTTFLKQNTKGSTAPFNFKTCYCFYTALSWIKLFLLETHMVSFFVIFALFAECHIRSVVNIKIQTHKHCFQQCGFNSVQISTHIFTP